MSNRLATNEQELSDCACCGAVDLYVHEQYPALDLVTEEWHIICKPCAESDVSSMDWLVPLSREDSVNASVPSEYLHLIEGDESFIHTSELPCGFVVECFSEFALEASIDFHMENCFDCECAGMEGGE